MKTRTENEKHEMPDTVKREPLTNIGVANINTHYGKKSGRVKYAKSSPKGITLVALVVTVVILLILAGVSIGTLFGDHGIIKKAQEAVDKTQEEVEKEQKEFENLLEQLNNFGNTEGGGEEPPEKVEMPEGWDERKVTPVKSADNKIVPVPKGFTASEVSRTVGENEEIENTVDGGFVIYQNITDNDEDELNKVNNDNVDTSNARTTRNQFVWVPVPEPTDMFTVDGNGNPAGQLYTFDKNSVTNKKGTKITYPTTKNSGMREPDVVTGATSGQESTSGSNYDAKPEYLKIVGLTGENATASKFKEQLQDKFIKMKASVEKYGGFYIGRYETGGLNATAKVVKGQGDREINNQNWYTMYQKSEKITDGTCATSCMIWGCQWDATMNWFLSQGGENAETVIKGIVNGVIRGSYSGPGGVHLTTTGSSEAYRVNNIYDLTGNTYEITLTAYENTERVHRRGILLEWG